jgi:hypothetical protein
MVSVRTTPRGKFGVSTEGDEYFDPIPLPDDADRQFSISVQKLVDIIRHQNGIEGAGVVAASGTIPLGQKCIEGYGIIEVYLLLPCIDLDRVESQCLSLARPSGIRKNAVLLPAVVRLSSHTRQLIDARGIVLIALGPYADMGSLDLAWKSHVTGAAADLPDGVHGPNRVVLGGTEYSCDLTKREMEFLAIALGKSEVELGSIIHRGEDALWRETFSDCRETRNKVTQFLSRLNKKLAHAKPPLALCYSLPRNRRSIVRD